MWLSHVFYVIYRFSCVRRHEGQHVVHSAFWVFLVEQQKIGKRWETHTQHERTLCCLCELLHPECSYRRRLDELPSRLSSRKTKHHNVLELSWYNYKTYFIYNTGQMRKGQRSWCLRGWSQYIWHYYSINWLTNWLANCSNRTGNWKAHLEKYLQAAVSCPEGNSTFVF